MKRFLFLLIPVFTLLAAQDLFAAGFMVDPSSIKIIDVPVGQSFEINGSTESGKYFINIANTDNVPSRYRIEIMNFQQFGRAPYMGHLEIPDLHWITIASPEIIVPGKQTVAVKGVIIKIPKEEKYYGKRYQAIIKVVREGEGRGLSMEVVMPLFIYTKKN